MQGYKGFFIIEQHASQQPTCYESDLGTLPDCFYVVSEYCKEKMLEVCNKLNVKVAPAFRFSHLFSTQDLRGTGQPIVLIALPIMFDEARHIVEVSIKLANKMSGDVKFLIKHHPSYTKEIIEKHIPGINDPVFEYTDKIMPELLERVSVIISSASSVCVEAVAVGIPVAIHGNRSGVTLNPIPLNVPKDTWAVFYTSEQLEMFVCDALTKKERNCIADKLFQPVDREGARSLFNFL